MGAPRSLGEFHTQGLPRVSATDDTGLGAGMGQHEIR